MKMRTNISQFFTRLIKHPKTHNKILHSQLGKSPIALCRSKEMRNLLAGFAQGSQGGLR
jgi:hypothetical protein